MIPAEAVAFMERLAALVNDDARTPDFIQQYEQAMNTFRRSVARDTPLAPKLNKGIRGSRYDSYTCGRCGAGIREAVEKYCWSCGQRVTDAYLGRRKTKEEQREHTTPARAAAIEEVAQMEGYDRDTEEEHQ